MAKTTQIQKTRSRAAATATKTDVTQKQSLETVQTLIHGGLSCLLWLRELCPDKAFDSRVYQTDSIISYDKYASGDLPSRPDGAKTSFTNLKILRRNRSKRANMFLDWLEKGAFSLLADGRLRAIQVYIHEDYAHRDQIIESYTFSIRYHVDGSGVRSPAGVEVGGPKAKAGTVGQASQDLSRVLRDIMRFCKDLPVLPVDKFMSTELFFYSHEEVSLQGFGPSTSNELAFAHAEGFAKQTRKETLNMKFHSADFKMSHLAFDPLQPAVDEMLHQFEYPEIVSRVEALELGMNEDEEQEAETVVEESPSKPISPVVEPAARLPRKSKRLASLAKPFPTPAATSQIPAPDLITSNTLAADSEMSSLGPQQTFRESLDTQSSQVPRMKRALRGMMESERLTQGDTQTQVVLESTPPTESQAARSATPTTASGGLDLRASAVRCQTPQHPGFDRVKRGRDEDDVFHSSPGRNSASNTPLFKRLKSLRSLDAFKANGLSSSPAPWAGS